MADAWIYDTETEQWLLVSETAGPSGREGHSAVFEASGEAFWIFGGYDGSFSNELWSYSRSTWSHVALVGLRPPARSQHVAWWDDRQEALWVHGGVDGEEILKDVWMFQSEQQRWSMALGPTEAPALKNHAAAWDEEQSTLWVHGGIAAAGAIAHLGRN